MSDLQDVRQEKISVNINGQEMPVEFDFNALAYLEEETKLGRYDFYRKLLNKETVLSTKEDLLLITAGLLRHNPKITVNEIGKLTNLEEIMDKTVRAYLKIFLQPEIYNKIYFSEEQISEAKKSQSPTEPTGAEI